MSELIDQDSRKWNDGLISMIFLEDEAKIIRGIPISPLPSEDRIIWRGTKNGFFSVRSAYFLELEDITKQRGSASNSDEGVIWREC